MKWGAEVSSQEVIAAENVTVDFGRGPVLKAVSLSIPGPGLFGILGPNGAGKTTLLSLLEGLSEPDQGHLRLFGEPLRRKGYPRHRVGVVLQRECAFAAIRVGEYADLFAALYGLEDGRARILSEARLEDRVSQPLSTLSGGEAQRLYVSAASAHSPDLLLLDEPTASLDPENKRLLGESLKSRASRCTVVMTTHDLREAETLCDRVAFLVDGELKACGTLAELMGEDQSLEETFFRYCSVRMSSRGELL